MRCFDPITSKYVSLRWQLMQKLQEYWVSDTAICVCVCVCVCV